MNAVPMLASYGIGYVYAGWAITTVVTVAYAVSLVVRGRRIARSVPRGRRRWSDPS